MKAAVRLPETLAQVSDNSLHQELSRYTFINARSGQLTAMSELLRTPSWVRIGPFFRQGTLILVLLSVSSCSTLHPTSTATSSLSPSETTTYSWTYSDLRRLDAPDAQAPGQDILAAYVYQPRSIGGGSQSGGRVTNEIVIRIDFLDLVFTQECDLYLALDYLPGGAQALPTGHPAQIPWDTLVVFPASGPIQAQDVQGGSISNLALKIVRDPDLDTITISFNAAGLSGSARRFRFQLFTTAPGESAVADSLTPFDSTGLPPARARILLAFWNVFPAYTPAQALRRWDGAHTGPFGGRHGLYNLLRTARNHRVSLTLLDLKSPISLSALDFTGGLDLIRQMSAEGLLNLPDTFPIPGSTSGGLGNINPSSGFIEGAMEFNREISRAFEIPASQMIYAPVLEGIPDRYSLILTNLPVQGNGIADLRAVAPDRWRDKVVISLPEEPGVLQATTNGLTIDTRRRIIQAAIQAGNPEAAHEETIFILGGSLPDSEWGIPQIARSGFRYITEHPWMDVINAQELISLRPSRQARHWISAGTEFVEPQASGPFDAITDQLASGPSSDLRHNAWGAFSTLYGPQAVSSPELSSLRAAYLGQLNVLLAAERWAAAPETQSTCSVDLDLDGSPECVLASHGSFIVLELDTGALAYAFIRTPEGLHQVIAPSSQFAIGTSDPSSWDLTAGSGADPDVIPGGFADNLGPFKPQLDESRIVLKADNIEKTYRLVEGGISIEIKSGGVVHTAIPLTMDPWERFQKDWAEGLTIFEESPAWLQFGRTRIVLQTQATVEMHAFTESRQLLASPEDPNLDYPPGHTLPFPLVLATIQSPGPLQLLLRVEE